MNFKNGSGRRAAKVSLALLIVMIIIGSFTQNSGSRGGSGKNLAPPNRSSLMGTDRLGRDMSRKVVEGLAGTAFLVAGALTISLPLALAFGFTAGFLAGRFRASIRNLVILTLLFLMTALIANLPADGLASAAGLLLGPPWPVAHISMLFSAFLISAAALAWGLLACVFSDIEDEPTGPGSPGIDILTPCIEAVHSAWATIPCYVLAMVLLGFMGHSPVTTTLALGLTAWPYPAGVIAAAVLACRDSDFVVAAKACGSKRSRIIFGHVAGNMAWAAWHGLAAMAAYAAAGEATLGYLDIGAGSGFVTLGSIAAEFKDYPEAWWLALFPCAATAWLVMTLTGLGGNKIRQI